MFHKSDELKKIKKRGVHKSGYNKKKVVRTVLFVNEFIKFSYSCYKGIRYWRVLVPIGTRFVDSPFLKNYVLWYIDLIFGMWLYLDELQFKFEFRSGRMIFGWVMALELIFFVQILSCPNFFLTSFDILTWYLVCGFIAIFCIHN
jgi:hypothetical protein